MGWDGEGGRRFLRRYREKTVDTYSKGAQRFQDMS